MHKFAARWRRACSGFHFGALKRRLGRLLRSLRAVMHTRCLCQSATFSTIAIASNRYFYSRSFFPSSPLLHLQASPLPSPRPPPPTTTSTSTLTCREPTRPRRRPAGTHASNIRLKLGCKSTPSAGLRWRTYSSPCHVAEYRF